MDSPLESSVRSPKGRGYQTDFESHKNLLHKFARMLMRRLMAVGLSPDYEDVFADMCECYCRAVLSYDPARGITFSAYLGRAVWNNTNPVTDRLIAEHQVIGHCPLNDFAADAGEDDDSIMDRLTGGDAQLSPEQLAERNEDTAQRVHSLPPLARAVMKELVAPSEGLRCTFAAMKAHREQARALKRRSKPVPDSITLPVIYQHLGLTQDQINTVHQQCVEYLGVDIHVA